MLYYQQRLYKHISLLKLPVYKQQVENYMPHQYLLQVMTVKFLQGQTTE